MVSRAGPPRYPRFASPGGADTPPDRYPPQYPVRGPGGAGTPPGYTLSLPLRRKRPSPHRIASKPRQTKASYSQQAEGPRSPGWIGTRTLPNSKTRTLPDSKTRTLSEASGRVWLAWWLELGGAPPGMALPPAAWRPAPYVVAAVLMLGALQARHLLREHRDRVQGGPSAGPPAPPGR